MIGNTHKESYKLVLEMNHIITFCACARDETVLQAKALEKTEVLNRFAIAEENDDIAGVVELTFFQARVAAVVDDAAVNTP